MASQTEKLKTEIENAIIFTLSCVPDPARLQKIEHWPQVIDFLITRKTAGMFFGRLRELNACRVVPAPELERCLQFYYFTALKNKVFFEELKKIWKLLQGQGTSAVLLKGSALILRGLYQPGERYQADLDFLVCDIEREKLKELVATLGYQPVTHSDQRWWSEEHFIRSGSKGLDDMFSAFLEFHWTFRPLNLGGGEELAKAIFQSSRRIAHKGTEYKIPSPEIQFYQAGIHGSAYHPFDSAYFWVSLADQARLSAHNQMNYSMIAEFAKSQGLIEHLGVMGWLLKEKLGHRQDLWSIASQKVPQAAAIMEETAEAVWSGLLNPQPFSFANLVYLFSRSSLRDRVRACLELAGMTKGEHVQVQGVMLSVARAGFFRSLRSKLRRLDWGFLRLVCKMAVFYRSIGFRIPKNS